jgi:hypothetical protein
MSIRSPTRRVVLTVFSEDVSITILQFRGLRMVHGERDHTVPFVHVRALRAAGSLLPECTRVHLERTRAW